MKKLIAACAAFVVSACLVGAQGTVFQNYWAIGPGSGNTDYTSFLANMVSTMRGNSLTPVHFIPSGSTISATNVMTHQDNTGSVLASGFTAVNPTPFTIDPFLREFWSQSWGSTNSISGASFGVAAMGIKWGPNGKDDVGGYTYYTSGSASTILLNEIFVVANTYTFRIGSDTIQQGLNSFYNAFGSTLFVNARYSLGSDCGLSTINISVPEPSAITIISIGFISLLFRKTKK